MSKDTFLFKQFAVQQDLAAMKVGTDGVLLGAWASSYKHEAILDIGAGTGLIALMMAQRFSEASIEAIEIDSKAAEQARANFEKSPWSERLKLHEGRIQEFASDQFYHLIVSNPPFFENSKKSGDEAKDLARHNDQLAYTELIFAANNLLKEKGTFAVIIPAENAEKFIRLSKTQGLHCNKVCWVKPTPEKEPKRALIAFNKFKEEKQESSELVIEQGGRHEYSSEYIQLTQDFYLNM